jgi:hypothetical protein
MKTTTKQTALFMILFGITVMSGSYFLFERKENHQSEVKNSKEQISNLKSKIKTIEKDYETAVSKLEKRNDSLQSQIQNTESAFIEAKRKVLLLRGNVSALADKVIIEKDTVQKLTACDTLAVEVQNLIAANIVSDSLCDVKIEELKSVIANRDSVIAIGEQSFEALKQSAESSLAQQMELTDKLKMADKKISRGKIKTKIFSAAVMVLSGITTALLISQ